MVSLTVRSCQEFESQCLCFLLFFVCLFVFLCPALSLSAKQISTFWRERSMPCSAGTAAMLGECSSCCWPLWLPGGGSRQPAGPLNSLDMSTAPLWACFCHRKHSMFPPAGWNNQLVGIGCPEKQCMPCHCKCSVLGQWGFDQHDPGKNGPWQTSRGSLRVPWNPKCSAG